MRRLFSIEKHSSFAHRDTLNRPMSSHNLALALSTRYNQLGAIQDLNEAIPLSREALDVCPQTYTNRPGYMNNLVGCLFTRYKQLGEMQDLDEAIVLAQEALDLCPQGHPYRSEYLTNPACRLSTRYNQLGRMGDLTRQLSWIGKRSAIARRDTLIVQYL